MAKKVPVSDHALLRYLQRVIGLDIEEAKCHIYTDKIAQAAKQKAKSIYIDGYTYILEGDLVVTILEGKCSYRDK